MDDKSTFSHFTGIKVDGKKVSTGNYTKESGSVIIKLKPKYLNKLDNGKHKLTAEFDDGSAAATFSVADKGNGNSEGSSGSESGSSDGHRTSTGDSHSILIWIIIMIAAVTGFSATILTHRRRIHSRR